MFGKEDAQSDALRKAADKANFRATLVKSAEAAIESFMNNQQDLVIIDCRHSIYFDHDKLCRCVLVFLMSGVPKSRLSCGNIQIDCLWLGAGYVKHFISGYMSNLVLVTFVL